MTNKTALITGASSGIGLQFAKLHAHYGGDLILVARRYERLLALKEELENTFNIRVAIFAIDLSKPGAAEKLYLNVTEQKLQVDYLINNAGFGDFGYFHKTDWEKDEQMINLNIMALTQLTKLFVSDMIKRGSGKILNVASTAAFMPGPLMAIYFASKSYVLAFSEAVANELKGTGVSLTALCPGPTESEFQDAANMEESMLFKRSKVATSEDVAKYGYNQMIKGKVVAIEGAINKFSIFASRFVPKNVLTSIVRRIQESKT